MLLERCDDELACILRYLDAKDAVCVSKVCTRLKWILMNRTDAWSTTLDLGNMVIWDSNSPVFAWDAVETARMPDFVLWEWDERWMRRLTSIQTMYARSLDASTPSLVRVLGNLRRLEMCGNGNSKSVAIRMGLGRDMARQLTCMETLRIDHMRIDLMNMQAILTLPKLRTLTLGDGAFCTSALKPHTGPVAPIEYLDISDCQEHLDLGIGAYTKRMPLRTLVCREHGKDFTHQSTFSMLRNTEYTAIEELGMHDPCACIGPDGEAISLIERMTSLRRLTLRVHGVSDHALAVIASMPQAVETDIEAWIDMAELGLTEVNE